MNVFIQAGHFILLSLLAFNAMAAHQPLWEGGLGIGSISTPFYPGSSFRKDYFFPVPFIRLRGRVFKADEDGARGKLFSSENSTLDISLAGNVPVPKVNDGARRGMPPLDAIGEIGPAYQYRLWRSETRRDLVQIEIPLRAVVSVGDPLLAYQGWRSTPFLYYLHKKYSGKSLWRTSLSIGPMFGDHRYHDYFYLVEPQYAQPGRDTYRAPGGYSGSRITFTLSRNRRSSFLGFFMRYDNLSGAAFSDSPLVEQNHYSIFGIVAVWMITHSEASAQHDDE